MSMPGTSERDDDDDADHGAESSDAAHGGKWTCAECGALYCTGAANAPVACGNCGHRFRDDAD